MKINKDLQKMSKEQLEDRLEEFKKEVFKANSKASAGNNPESPGKLRQTKKNIARVLSELSKREQKVEK